MKKIRTRVALALLAVFLTGVAHATTSSVNPNVPATNSPLSSAALRQGISQPAYNDITTLFGLVTTGGGGGGGITALTGDVTASGTGSVATTLANTTTARTSLGLGSAATVNTGTSGATLGLLNGNLTLSGSDLFTGTTKFSLNAASLPAAQTGSVAQVGGADGVASAVEVDAFGAGGGHYRIVGYGGTAASPTALAASTTLPIGSYNFWGYDGTAVGGPNASVRAYPSQAWSVGSHGMALDLAVTPNGSTTLTQALLLNQDGGITTPSVAGGDKGAGTINAAGLYVSGVAVGSGSGAVFQIQPSSYYTSDTAGNLVPYLYTGSGGNAAATEAGWGVAASLGADATLQLRFPMPVTIPSGTFKLRSNCLASAGSGTAKYTISDADVASGSSPSAATLSAEAQTTLSITTTGGYLQTDTALTSVPVANHTSVVAVAFNSSGWTLAQVLACRWSEVWF